MRNMNVQKIVNSVVRPLKKFNSGSVEKVGVEPHPKRVGPAS